MSNQNVEVQLRKSFKAIFPETLKEDEKQFVQSCQYYVGLLDICNTPVGNTREMEKEDVLKPATIAVNNNNIVILEKECISFGLDFIGEIASLATGNILPIAGALFALGCKLYLSKIKVDDEQMEFYRYLVAHDYTLRDRIAGGLDGGMGFVLADAIERYYEYTINKGYSESKETFMEKINDTVSYFSRKGLLEENNHKKGRYIIHF